MSHRAGSCRKINHEDSPPLFSIQEIMIHPAQIALIAFAVLTSTVAQAAEVDFVRDVRPILQQHCYACHGEKKQKSGLRLDIKSEAFKGGDGYGPSVIAGEIRQRIPQMVEQAISTQYALPRLSFLASDLLHSRFQFTLHPRTHI